MSKSRVVIITVLGFSSGIVFCSTAFIDLSIIFFTTSIVISITLFCFLFTKQLIFSYFVLIAVSFCAGSWRVQHSFSENQYTPQLGTYQEFEGQIVEEPDVRVDKQLLTIQPNGFSQRLLVTVSNYSKYHYGDSVWVKGNIREVKNFSEFDYQKYLERYNVYVVMSYPKIIALRSGQGNKVINQIFKLKEWFSEKISRLYKTPERNLLLGILLGSKSSLPRNITEDFRITGLSHIVAVSGFNISVLVASLGFLPKLLGRRWALLPTILIIFGFVVLTGASSSVVRAGIMGMFLLLAAYAGRLYHSLTTLFLVFGIMALQNPRVVMWDVGFQLSFAALVGILFISPKLEQFFISLPSLVGLKTIILITTSVLLVTAPITIWQFGQFSLIAPLTNSIVLPMVPTAMLGGALSLLPVVGPGFAWLTSLLLSAMLFVANFGSKIPYAQLVIERENKIWVIGIWAIGTAIIFLRSHLLLGKKARLSGPAPHGIISKQNSNYTLNV